MQTCECSHWAKSQEKLWRGRCQIYCKPCTNPEGRTNLLQTRNNRSKKLKRILVLQMKCDYTEQCSTQRKHKSLAKQNNDSSMIPSISPQLPPHITKSQTTQLILTFPPCHLIILSFVVSPYIKSPYFEFIPFVTQAQVIC